MQTTKCALTKASELRVFSPPDKLEMFFQLFFGGLTLKQSDDFIIYQHSSIFIFSIFFFLRNCLSPKHQKDIVLLRKYLIVILLFQCQAKIAEIKPLNDDTFFLNRDINCIELSKLFL